MYITDNLTGSIQIMYMKKYIKFKNNKKEFSEITRIVLNIFIK